MIFIKHRVNSVTELKKTNIEFGVEIDLRSENKKIYLHHDPFKKGEAFEKWIKHYRHRIIVLNVKEEGLEDSIIKILKKYKSNVDFKSIDYRYSFSNQGFAKNKIKNKVSEYIFVGRD